MEPTDNGTAVIQEPVEDYFEYLLWIATSEENLPYLQSINVQVGEYTGTTYLNCLVPKWALRDMWDNWGELMFGVMEEEHGDTVESWHNANAAAYCARVIARMGSKEVPLLVQMGFMRKPAARKVEHAVP
jgi:hypothetical protein